MEPLREHRLLHLKVSENMKEWWRDTSTTYIKGPIQEKDPIKAGVGALMAASGLFFEAPDYLVAGVADDPLKAPSGTRTWRDIKSIGTNNVRHPIRTVLGGLRLLGDVPRDGIDLLFGFRHDTQAKMQAAMTQKASAPSVVRKEENSYVLGA